MMGLFRKVIRITALDSPNVRLGLKEVEAGLTPSNEMICPGVLSWEEFVQRKTTWDEQRQCVGLYGQFWEGAEIMLFPREWLNRAMDYAGLLDAKYTHGGFSSSGLTGVGGKPLAGVVRDQERTYSSLSTSRLIPRKAESIGVDPAEGGDSSSWAAVDHFGLIELVSKKTPDTNVIPRETLAFARRHGLSDWSRIIFDTGGGGKQHADSLRASGFKVRTVGFGESVSPPLKRGSYKRLAVREDEKEERYEYVNRRAEMYGELRELLSPFRIDPHSGQPLFFGLPRRYEELHRQLGLMPLLYDNEGRLRMLPKNRKAAKGNATEPSLTEILGRSPDDSDALVLAVHGLLHAGSKSVAGAVKKVGERVGGLSR